MKSPRKRIFFIISVLLIGLSGYSQNVEQYLKKAEKAEKEKKYSEAYSFYKKANTADAWYKIADLMHREHLPDNTDFRQIYDFLKQPADSGNHKAEIYLGGMYRNGYYVEKDRNKAIDWFEKAAASDDKIAQNDLAWEYFADNRYEEAAKYFQLSSDKKFSAATNNLAWLYEHGFGVEKDVKKAEELYKKAAAQGFVKALNNLGGLFQNEYKDDCKAAYWWEKAAKKGLENAQRNLGLSYANGSCVKYNYKKAVYWLTKASEQNFEKAQYSLARLYYSKKDYPNALYWYEKSAEQGTRESRFITGNMYFSGAGGIRDHEKAAYWWEKAAEQGDERAEKNLRIVKDN